MKMKAVILLLSLALSPSVWAGGESVRSGGDSVGNGGDVIAAEFAARARAIVRRAIVGRALRPVVNNVWRAIATTTVRTEEHLFLKNHEVDAINYPSKRLIVVSSSRWARRNDKSVLVMHEYLWVAGYDDSGYELSQQLVSLSQYHVNPPTF